MPLRARLANKMFELPLSKKKPDSGRLSGAARAGTASTGRSWGPRQAVDAGNAGEVQTGAPTAEVDATTILLIAHWAPAIPAIGGSAGVVRCSRYNAEFRADRQGMHDRERERDSVDTRTVDPLAAT